LFRTEQALKKPQLTGSIGVALFLGGPGRNRTTDTRISIIRQSQLSLSISRALAPQSQLAQKIVYPSLIGQAPWLLLSITDIRLMPSKQKNTYITGAMTQVINNKSQYNKCT
jgi:hypothetical protein